MYSYVAAFGISKAFNSFNFYDILFSVAFAFDMIIRFLVAPEDSTEKKITKFKDIATIYLKKDFIIDLLTVMPLNMLIKSNDDE